MLKLGRPERRAEKGGEYGKESLPRHDPNLRRCHRNHHSDLRLFISLRCLII